MAETGNVPYPVRDSSVTGSAATGPEPLFSAWDASRRRRNGLPGNLSSAGYQIPSVTTRSVRAIYDYQLEEHKVTVFTNAGFGYACKNHLERPISLRL